MVYLNPGVASGGGFATNTPYSRSSQRQLTLILSSTPAYSAQYAGSTMRQDVSPPPPPEQKKKNISFFSGPSRLTADFASEGWMDAGFSRYVHTYIHKVWISHSSGISLNRLSADLWPVQRGLAVLWLFGFGRAAAQLNGIYIRNISPQ